MSADKLADSQKKLELATNLVIAFINSKNNNSDDEKEKNKNSLGEKQILDLLEKTFNKMHDLVPFQERKIGLGH